jgi:hypothetical protein
MRFELYQLAVPGVYFLNGADIVPPLWPLRYFLQCHLYIAAYYLPTTVIEQDFFEPPPDLEFAHWGLLYPERPA